MESTARAPVFKRLSLVGLRRLARSAPQGPQRRLIHEAGTCNHGGVEIGWKLWTASNLATIEPRNGGSRILQSEVELTYGYITPFLRWTELGLGRYELLALLRAAVPPGG